METHGPADSHGGRGQQDLQPYAQGELIRRRGQDDRHISTVDADGVALAAIQALDKLSREKDKKIDQLTRELDALRAALEPLQRATAKVGRLRAGPVNARLPMFNRLHK
jgi:hypothetical protein